MDKQKQSGWTEGQRQQRAEQPHLKQQGGQHQLSPAGPGEARTPDRRIGQVAHAEDMTHAEDDVKARDKADTAPDQGIVRDKRDQDQPADQKRAQQSALEGPAAYAPHEEDEKSVKPAAAKQRPQTPPDSDTQGGVGSQGGM